MISLISKRTHTLPMAECVLDLSIKMLIRRIYCATSVQESTTAKDRFTFCDLQMGMNQVDEHMALVILLSKNKLVRWARNYLITMIDFRYKLIAINQISYGVSTYSEQVKNAAIQVFEPFADHIGKTNRSDLKMLSVYISALPYLIFKLCQLIIFDCVSLDFAFFEGESKEDIEACFDRLNTDGNQQVAMLISFSRELSPYADYLQKLIAKTVKRRNNRLVN